MRLDVFACNRIHFAALGSVPTLPEFFGFFQTIVVIFGNFWPGGLTFMDILRVGGLTFIGANYWEVALTASIFVSVDYDSIAGLTTETFSPERSPNGPRTDPERIPRGPRTDLARTPNGPRADSERTPRGSQTDPNGLKYINYFLY